MQNLCPHFPFQKSSFDESVARTSYEAKWSGCLSNKERKYLLKRKAVELFMICTGFSLIFLSSYIILGGMLVISGIYLTCDSLHRHTFKALFNGKMEDCIGRILGKKEFIETLPIFENSKDKKGIMRTVNDKGATQSVIFVYTAYKEKKGIQKCRKYFWMFLFNLEENRFIYKPSYEIRIKDDMPGNKELFLTHLVKQKGYLAPNSDRLSYKLNDGVDWEKFKR